MMPGRSKTLIHIILWTGSIGFVLVAGVCYFPLENPGISFFESLYYTLRLFIFEHDLPQFPKSPILIFIHFFAPAIALSAAGTALTYLFRLSPTLKIKWMSHHVIICGVGHTGKLIAKTLKSHDVPVIAVDLGPPDNFDSWCEENKISMIYGDFHSQSLLRKAGSDRARSIIFTSGSDMANLEGAIGIYDCHKNVPGPPRIIWAHIADEKLADTARVAVKTEGNISIRFFDTYWIAASKMIDEHFNPELRKGIREIVVLGFGKFGRDLTEVLIHKLKNDNDWKILIVDKHDKANEVRRMALEQKVSDRISFMKSSIQDLYPESAQDKAIFVCTDDDIGNLTVALLLTSQMKPSKVFVRMTTWPISAIAEHFGKNQEITFININELVIQGIEQLPGVFSPAKETDLKRIKRNEDVKGDSRKRI